MPKDGNAGFEVPADMLALAEKSVEQAKQHSMFSFQRRSTL
jgi:hypothetical protein